MSSPLFFIASRRNDDDTNWCIIQSRMLRNCCKEGFFRIKMDSSASAAASNVHTSCSCWTLADVSSQSQSGPLRGRAKYAIEACILGLAHSQPKAWYSLKTGGEEGSKADGSLHVLPRGKYSGKNTKTFPQGWGQKSQGWGQKSQNYGQQSQNWGQKSQN